jgi:hypothetical protein
MKGNQRGWYLVFSQPVIHFSPSRIVPESGFWLACNKQGGNAYEAKGFWETLDRNQKRR